MWCVSVFDLSEKHETLAFQPLAIGSSNQLDDCFSCAWQQKLC